MDGSCIVGEVVCVWFVYYSIWLVVTLKPKPYYCTTVYECVYEYEYKYEVKP
jgi:hypothetical protein